MKGILGDYDKAKNLIAQGLRIYNKHSLQNHCKVAWGYATLGSIHRWAGDYEKSKHYLEKALKTYEKCYGGDTIETARVLGSLGQVYFRQNSLEKSEELLQKALKLFQKSSHSEMYMILENLSDICLKKSVQVKEKAEVETAQNLKTQGIDYLKKALGIVNTSFPEDSPHITRIQNKLNSLREG